MGADFGTENGPTFTSHDVSHGYSLCPPLRSHAGGHLRSGLWHRLLHGQLRATGLGTGGSAFWGRWDGAAPSRKSSSWLHWSDRAALRGPHISIVDQGFAGSWASQASATNQCNRNDLHHGPRYGYHCFEHMMIWCVRLIFKLGKSVSCLVWCSALVRYVLGYLVQSRNTFLCTCVSASVVRAYAYSQS